MELTELSVAAARDGLRKRAFSAVELAAAYLTRIEAHNARLNVYITVSADEALRMAREADARLAAGDMAPLLGIPLALKDNLSTAGIRTTAASRMLENYVPTWDATCVARLKAAGAVLLGKTNLDEFSMGSSTENSAFGPTLNPHDTTRVAGGTSGGSAAAVAAGLAMAAIGTDTGGSLRCPASFCGITAIKNSYGRVSRWGLLSYGSSLDSIGVCAQDAADAAIINRVIAGHDPLDSTCVDQPVPDYAAALGDGSLKGVRVGIPREYFASGLQPEVDRSVRAAIAQLASLGATLVEVSLPNTHLGVPVYYIIAPAEVSSNLSRYEGVKYGLRVPADDIVDMARRTRAAGFGPEAKRRIMLGTYALSAGYYDAYYTRAQRVRTLIKRDFERAFEQVDVMAAPTMPTTAFKLGAKTADPLTMYLEDALTAPMNLAGTCGMSIPCGRDDAGMPIGLQLMGPWLGEQQVLRVAHAYQMTGDR